MRPRCLAAFFAFVLALLLMLPIASAQFPQAGDTTSPPNGAAGHNYIHAPGETVNPANGLPSIRIPLRIPSGRELTIPLSIAYDSAAAFYYGSSQGNSNPHWATPPNVPFSKGGWSYTFPLVTYTQQNWTETNGFKNFTCHEGINFVFQDPSGNRHNLGLTPVTNPGTFYTCSPSPGILNGGEGPISAITSSGVGGCCKPVTITDGNGTYYSFNQAGTTLFQSLPSSITDRNGNSISISVSGSPISSATVTDTVGRTAVSVGTFGGSPDSINVAGLSSAYKVYWTTASANFTIGVYPSGSCPTSLSGSVSAVSQVVLPNGQNYTFSYDPTYGMLNKITYPTGGYVRYVWGLNPLAQVLHYPVYDNLGNYVTTYNCRYDFPAITDRYVSTDGTTEVLHQHFSYSTSWSGTMDQYNSKTTTVTTYDLVRNTNFNTTYTYSPISAPCVMDLNPNSNSGCVGDFTMQIPVEKTVQYYDTTGSLLRTATKSWINNDPRTLGSEQTTLDNGQSSLTVYCYNTNEQVTETDSYDLGTSAPTLPTCASGVPPGTVAGSLLRATVTSYATFGANHIVDRPSSVIVYSDAAKTVKVAETDYAYDNPVGTTTSGIVQHVTGCNCGNLTKTAQWLNSTGTTLSPTYTNDDTGQRLSMTDPRGNTTTYSYADNYSSGTPPGPTNAYLTQVTDPQTSGVNHVEHFAYAYASGEVTSSPTRTTSLPRTSTSTISPASPKPTSQTAASRPTPTRTPLTLFPLNPSIRSMVPDGLIPSSSTTVSDSPSLTALQTAKPRPGIARIPVMTAQAESVFPLIPIKSLAPPSRQTALRASARA